MTRISDDRAGIPLISNADYIVRPFPCDAVPEVSKLVRVVDELLHRSSNMLYFSLPNQDPRPEEQRQVCAFLRRTFPYPRAFSQHQAP